MKFRNRLKDEPEINLIPFIDVLLVIIIFLMLTTTYNQISALQIRLPSASAQVQESSNNKINVVVTADGSYAINGTVINNPTVSTIAHGLQQAANQQPDSIIIISADSNAAHQNVVIVMDAARQAGLPRLTIATRTPE